jgi:DNA-binding beta-propeller fold protein YncE
MQIGIADAKPMRRLLCSIFLALTFTSQAAQPLTLRAIVPLPGVKGRFDHFAIDAKGGRIFVAALGNNTVEVVDLRNAQKVKSVGGMSKPCGICFLPQKNQIGVANGGRGSFDVLDAAAFTKTKEIPELDDADNVRFDPNRNLIFVGFGSGAIGVIDAAKSDKVAEVKLKSHPEAFQLEKNGPRIFVNVPGVDEVVVVDREKRAVVAEWPLHGFKGNFPMALDEAGKRVFVGCRSPARLIALDSETGKVAGDMEIASDTDDLFFDAKRNRVYVSCGEGFVDVISCAPGEKMKRIRQVTTRSGARTSFYSPDLDELYVAVPQRDGEPAQIRIFKPE